MPATPAIFKSNDSYTDEVHKCAENAPVRWSVFAKHSDRQYIVAVISTEGNF